MRALLALLVLSAAGCASPLDRLASGGPPLERQNPEEAYLTGLQLFREGELESAKREWDRCVALSAPESRWRLECTVALEQLDKTRD